MGVWGTFLCWPSRLKYNNTATLASLFTQRATREVARTCYTLFFKKGLQLNHGCAPWHVRVARRIDALQRDGALAAAVDVMERATQPMQLMQLGVLVGTSWSASATFAGSVSGVLVIFFLFFITGFNGFTTDKHAQRLLVACQAHANRACDRAPRCVLRVCAKA